ncbi:isopentenyl pyrophosphate isomerase, partial [Halobacteriales archaeon QS_9_70_65]
ARRESEAALSALETADVVDSKAVGYLQDLAEFVIVRER